jgi:anti-sigma factor RsiW
MSEHATEWLNAFLDGELHEPHLRQVQDHLARCAACRAELEDLRGVSQILKEAASSEANQPSDRFIAELIRMLPPREYPVAPWKGKH